MKEPSPPTRSFTLQIEIPSCDSLPEALFSPFSKCCAEAQMLENAIKTAITKDVHEFANPGELMSALDALERATLGQAKDIIIGTSGKKQIAACIGFYDFVKAQWVISGRPESALPSSLKDAVDRRNRVAHVLLAEVLQSKLSTSDALLFLQDSAELFLQLRIFIVAADAISSHSGSIAADGSLRSRFKTTQ
jgi:hypothetical protein